ncbi:Rieske iron-sulfur protein [Nonomuraea cavernae]|uniref:Rieske iron-sulfur protein n=2 Tax=Nonomuraea cavernae TaxID=2045107 RepID=A0A918DPS5_9ACTN|nr:Rieske iron-sulfur protein [Nonomuraea cavernae]
MGEGRQHMRSSERGFAMPEIGRRQALGVAGVAACGLALAGCGADAAEPERAQGIKGQVIAKTADVPVGGGTVVDRWRIVVTQPTEGVYKAFSAVCPHRGCAVGLPKENVMTCPCHGSEFAADTGKALTGPATGQLTAYQVKVEGDGIVVV